MTETSSQDGESTKAKQVSNPLDNLMEFITAAIDEVDEKAAEARVQALREANAGASPEELVELLIKQKCIQTGAVGAITSGASFIPGLGTFASMTFGVAADIAWTFKLQAELVLEIAAVYQHKLSPTEKRNTVMLVTGISAGANQVLRKTGQRVAEEATERLAQKSLTKAIPVLGTAASAGTNILFTYVIGQRAQAYFSRGPDAVGDWGESIRAITGIDERKIGDWLADWGKSMTEGVASGARKASETVADAGKSVAERASTAADAVVETGRKTRSAVATGAERAAGAVTDLGDRVGEKASSTKDRVKDTFRRSKRGGARREEEESENPEAD